MTEKDTSSETGIWSESPDKPGYDNTHNEIKEWPGAFGIYKSSRDAVRLNIDTIIILFLGYIFVSFAFSFLLRSNAFGDIISELISITLASIYTISTTYVYISGASKKRVDIESALTIPKSLIWKMILLELLIGAIVMGGFIFFIVPGIIIAMRLSLAPYYLVDQDLGVMDAFNASWNATKGNLGKIWGIIGVYLLMVIPIITIVGIIATIYFTLMYSAVMAFLYLHLLQKPADNK